MKELKFSKDFKKLESKMFSTLRLKMGQYKTGEMCQVVSPSNSFLAEVLISIRIRICELDDDFLMRDTDTMSRAAALDLLREFYPELEEETMVNAYVLARGLKGESS